MKRILVVSMIFVSVLMSGCLGRNALFNKVQDWNATATNQKFVNQAISFAFWFLPVYGLTLLGDIVILNSVEFWTGSNPLSGESARVTEAGTTRTYEDGFGNIAEVTYGEDNKVFVKEHRGDDVYQYTLAMHDGQVSVDGYSPSVATK